MPHFRCAWIRDRVCRQRGRLDLPGSRPRRILADQPAAARGSAGPAAANRCRAVARGDGGGAREERGGHAAGDAARAAGAGLPGRVPRRPGRRQERRRDRRGRGRTRRHVRRRWRRAAHRARRAAPAGRLGREGVGHGAGRRGRRGRSARVPAVHGRGHRVGAGRAARHRRGGHRRRPGGGLADGAAPRGNGVGTGDRPRVRLLLRAALPVPAGQQPGQQDRRRGRRVHAGRDGRAGEGRRPRADPRRADRRRGAGHAAEAGRQPLLARPDHGRQKRPAVPSAGQPCGT